MVFIPFISQQNHCKSLNQTGLFYSSHVSLDSFHRKICRCLRQPAIKPRTELYFLHLFFKMFVKVFLFWCSTAFCLARAVQSLDEFQDLTEDISNEKTRIDILESGNENSNEINEFQALKRIHQFVYPKIFNVLNDQNELSPRENTSSSVNNSDNAELKHANLDFTSGEGTLRPTFPAHPSANPNFHGILSLIDPIFLMAVFGFIVYLINSVLRIVDRVHLIGPLLSSTPAASMLPTNLPRHQFDMLRSPKDVNDLLMRDFERILNLTIEMFEEKYH